MVVRQDITTWYSALWMRSHCRWILNYNKRWESSVPLFSISRSDLRLTALGGHMGFPTSCFVKRNVRIIETQRYVSWSLTLRSAKNDLSISHYRQVDTALFFRKTTVFEYFSRLICHLCRPSATMLIHCISFRCTVLVAGGRGKRKITV